MKYPNNIKKNYQNPLSFKNRGMDLEEELNISNEYYIEIDKALIYKKPTPIGVADVSYNPRGKVIEKAYFKEQSTLDYNGLYRGKYIEYEAKVTKNKTSFPLQNIHEHQVLFMQDFEDQGGIAFLLICFSSEQRYFYLPFKHLVEFWNRSKTGHRKSFHMEELDPAFEISCQGYYLNYLTAIQKDLDGRT